MRSTPDGLLCVIDAIQEHFDISASNASHKWGLIRREYPEVEDIVESGRHEGRGHLLHFATSENIQQIFLLARPVRRNFGLVQREDGIRVASNGRLAAVDVVAKELNIAADTARQRLRLGDTDDLVSLEKIPGQRGRPTLTVAPEDTLKLVERCCFDKTPEDMLLLLRSIKDHFGVHKTEASRRWRVICKDRPELKLLGEYLPYQKGQYISRENLAIVIAAMEERFSKKTPIPGVVYIVLCPEVDTIKVGRAKDVASRMYNLQIGCPLDLELLGTIATDDTEALEAEIHTKIESYARRGEWFDAKALQVLKDDYDIDYT